MLFEAMSGMRINLNKSEIIPIGPVDNVAELALELGCGIGSLPYLVFRSTPGSFPQGYMGLGLCFQKRLASWKM